jgi:hypothetical protein
MSPSATTSTSRSGTASAAWRSGGTIESSLRSRHDRSLTRYSLRSSRGSGPPTERFVLDGEVVATGPDGPSFPALLARLHPSASRVRRLREETPPRSSPSTYSRWAATTSARNPSPTRRGRLEALVDGTAGPILATVATDDPAVAGAWLDRFRDGGVDGVVAKHRMLRYQPGKRAMVKVKKERTADCVVAGFRFLVDRPLPSSLLLGLYDPTGTLRHAPRRVAFPIPAPRSFQPAWIESSRAIRFASGAPTRRLGPHSRSAPTRSTHGAPKREKTDQISRSCSEVRRFRQRLGCSEATLWTSNPIPARFDVRRKPSLS